MCYRNQNANEDQTNSEEKNDKKFKISFMRRRQPVHTHISIIISIELPLTISVCSEFPFDICFALKSNHTQCSMGMCIVHFKSIEFVASSVMPSELIVNRSYHRRIYRYPVWDVYTGTVTMHWIVFHNKFRERNWEWEKKKRKSERWTHLSY